MDYKAAVITVSDRCSTGEKGDKSGPAVAQMLEEAGFPVIYRGLVPDERHEIYDRLAVGKRLLDFFVSHRRPPFIS